MDNQRSINNVMIGINTPDVSASVPTIFAGVLFANRQAIQGAWKLFDQPCPWLPGLFLPPSRLCCREGDQADDSGSTGSPRRPRASRRASSNRG